MLEAGGLRMFSSILSILAVNNLLDSNRPLSKSNISWLGDVTVWVWVEVPGALEDDAMPLLTVSLFSCCKKEPSCCADLVCFLLVVETRALADAVTFLLKEVLGVFFLSFAIISQ